LISRVTLFSLLLGLMLGVGIQLWDMDHPDACARYLAGDPSAQHSIWVVSGTRTVEVSCNQWLPRQPLPIQLLCLLDLVFAVVFALNAMMDLRRSLEKRRAHSPPDQRNSAGEI
jgi:hypothetical protein